MRSRARLLVVATLGLCAAVACSLNPQPIPPDTSDAGAFGDATAAGKDGGGIDAASSDAGQDGSPAPGTDASTDASDASHDVADGGEVDGSRDDGD